MQYIRVILKKATNLLEFLASSYGSDSPISDSRMNNTFPYFSDVFINDLNTVCIAFFLQFYIDCKIKEKEIGMGKKCLCQKHDF